MDLTMRNSLQKNHILKHNHNSHKYSYSGMQGSFSYVMNLQHNIYLYSRNKTNV